MVFKLYKNKKRVGWLGWIETIKGEALAFVKLNGEVIWNW